MLIYESVENELKFLSGISYRKEYTSFRTTEYNYGKL